MENKYEKDLKELFRQCSEQYFINQFQQNKFLYFEVIPHNYFGTDYKVEIIHVEFEWLDNPVLKYDTKLKNIGIE
jgi:hypothetical protein